MKKFVVAANWKMYKNPRDAKSFFDGFIPLLKNSLAIRSGREIIFFPPNLLCETVGQIVASTEIRWGAQNCYFENEGAFTGENSPMVLKEMGAHTVLIGHSERRSLFGETDDLIARKVKAALSAGLSPMLCVGENLTQHEAGQSNAIVCDQLSKALAALKSEVSIKSIYVAYEPVWAIGTGHVATPDHVALAHAAIRANLVDQFGQAGNEIPILYGGSVKPDNSLALARVENLNGFLVGGASLKPESFAQICAN